MNCCVCERERKGHILAHQLSQCSRVRPNFSMMRLKKIWQAVQKKVSATLKVNNRRPLGSYRGLNQSEILKGGPPSDWPWFRYSCTCVYVWKCVCCYSQTEREVSSRDASSVANLATLSLDLATFQTPLGTFSFPKATSDKSSDFVDKL